MRRALPFSALVLVTSCVGPPPRPVPVPAVAYLPPPQSPPPAPSRPAGDWRDWPVTPGSWSYSPLARGALARFETGVPDAAVTLRCDRDARRITILLAGAGQSSVTLRTSSLARTLPLDPGGQASTLSASDPLLDAIAFSRGRFLIDRPIRPLVIPVHAEIGRVIEDCRG